MTNQCNSKNSNESEVLEEFMQMFFSNLAFLEDNDVSWRRGVGLATFHLTEFALCHSDGDLTEVSFILLHALASSGFKRHNLDDYANNNEIGVQFTAELSMEDEDVLKATLLLVATTVEALKELQEFQNKSKLGFH